MDGPNGADVGDAHSAPRSSATIPIANLKPDIDDLSSLSIHGIVSLIWPYSSSQRSLTLLLVEPDFRLRRQRGQVKVQFLGPSAKAVARAGITSGDDVTLSLEGVAFVQDASTQSTPGKSLEWDLRFGERLRLQHLRGSQILSSLDIDHPTPSPEPEVRSTTPPRSPVLRPTIQALQSPASEWKSPAFMKRVRLSAGSAFESAYDPFTEQDEFLDGRGAKRTKFGRKSGQWRYTERTPSPEKGDLSATSSLQVVGELTSDKVPQQVATAESNVEVQEPVFSSLPLPDSSTMQPEPAERAQYALQDEHVMATTAEIDSSVSASEPLETANDRSPHDDGDHIERSDMPPPRLSLLRTDIAIEQTTTVVETREAPDRPRTPEIRPAASPGLPLISPFPGTEFGRGGYFAADHREIRFGTEPMLDNVENSVETAVETAVEIRDIAQAQDVRNLEVATHVADIMHVERRQSFGLDGAEAFHEQLEELPQGVHERNSEPPEDDLHQRRAAEVTSTHTNLLLMADKTEVRPRPEGWFSTRRPLDEIPAVQESGETQTTTPGPDEPSEGSLDTRLLMDFAAAVSSAPSMELARMEAVTVQRTRSGISVEREIAVSTEDLYGVSDKEDLENQGSEGSEGMEGMESEEERAGETSENGSEKEDLEEESSEEVDVVEEMSIIQGDGKESVLVAASDYRAAQEQYITEEDKAEQIEIIDISSESEGSAEELSQEGTPERIPSPVMREVPQPVVTTASDDRTETPSSQVSEILPNDHASVPENTQLITPDATQPSLLPPELESTSVLASSDQAVVAVGTPGPVEDSSQINLERSSVSVAERVRQSRRASAARNSLEHPSTTIPDHLSTWFIPRQSESALDASPAGQIGVRDHHDRLQAASEPTEVQEELHGDDENTIVVVKKGRPIEGEEDTISAIGSQSSLTGSVNGFRTPLSYFSPLSSLPTQFSAAVDVLAVVVDNTDIGRAKSKPRDYHTTLRLTDPSSSPDTVIAQVFRPYKEALPIAKIGDVVLLRNFQVKSLNRRAAMVSGADSAWVVFHKGSGKSMEEQIRGPPVEFAAEERAFARGLTEWWNSLGEDGQERIKAGKGRGESRARGAARSIKDVSGDGKGQNGVASGVMHILRNSGLDLDGMGGLV